MRSLNVCIQHTSRVGGETWCFPGPGTKCLWVPVEAQDLPPSPVPRVGLQTGGLLGRQICSPARSSERCWEALPVGAGLHSGHLSESHTCTLVCVVSVLLSVLMLVCVIVLEVFSLNVVSLLSCRKAMPRNHIHGKGSCVHSNKI